METQVRCGAASRFNASLEPVESGRFSKEAWRRWWQYYIAKGFGSNNISSCYQPRYVRLARGAKLRHHLNGLCVIESRI
jgi:hypothetical protein